MVVSGSLGHGSSNLNGLHFQRADAATSVFEMTPDSWTDVHLRAYPVIAAQPNTLEYLEYHWWRTDQTGLQKAEETLIILGVQG